MFYRGSKAPYRSVEFGNPCIFICWSLTVVICSWAHGVVIPYRVAQHGGHLNMAGMQHCFAVNVYKQGFKTVKIKGRMNKNYMKESKRYQRRLQKLGKGGKLFWPCSKWAGDWVWVFNMDWIEKWSPFNIWKSIQICKIWELSVKTQRHGTLLKIAKIRELSMDWRDSCPSNPYKALFFLAIFNSVPCPCV